MFKKIILLLRVSNWSKAVFVLLGVLYAQTPSYTQQALLAAFSFCLIASAVYIYNDLQDIQEDKAHPHKSHRPLAKGDVSRSFACFMLMGCLTVGLLIGGIVSMQLVIILCLYLLINFLYNHWFRRVIFCDVLCIAAGFMLRVLAGTVGIGLPITWWLTITATLLSLFIALGKRRLEIQLRLHCPQREVLKKYTSHLLNILMASTATSCFVAYLLYTVYARNEVLYFLCTLPFCAIGLGRFAFLTNQDGKTDDLVALFLNDKVSRLNLLCFFALTIMALSQ